MSHPKLARQTIGLVVPPFEHRRLQEECPSPVDRFVTKHAVVAVRIKSGEPDLIVCPPDVLEIVHTMVFYRLSPDRIPDGLYMLGVSMPEQPDKVFFVPVDQI